jgi:hypothetical protein
VSFQVVIPCSSFPFLGCQNIIAAKNYGNRQNAPKFRIMNSVDQGGDSGGNPTWKQFKETGRRDERDGSWRGRREKSC